MDRILIMVLLSLFLEVNYCNTTNYSCANIRDPFVIPECKKKVQTKQPILLDGIVYAGQKRSAAVLVSGDMRKVVQRGERFMGHQLIMIGKNFVVLARGKHKQKLYIQ